MRIWGKIMKQNRLLRDHVIENYEDESRTTKIFAALNDLCVYFDLGVPIWLDSNIAEFQQHAKTRFHQDNFMEPIDFDFLEFHVIEEDY